MKNNYARELRERRKAFNEGVSSGCSLMCAVFLVALDNTAKTMFADSTVSKLLKKTEAESQRVFDEVMDSARKHEEEDMATILTYYTEKIRKERNMDEDQT